MPVPDGLHIVASIRDISHRREIERIKEDFIATVSHELRTPLTSVVGSLGLLRAGTVGPLPASAGHLVEIAENNARRLVRSSPGRSRGVRSPASSTRARMSRPNIASISSTVSCRRRYWDQSAAPAWASPSHVRSCSGIRAPSGSRKLSRAGPASPSRCCCASMIGRSRPCHHSRPRQPWRQITSRRSCRSTMMSTWSKSLRPL